MYIMQDSTAGLMLSLLVTLLGAGVVHGTRRCSAPYPDRCDCDPPPANKTGTLVYCRHLQLDYIPSQFPADTVEINLGFNRITTLTADSLQNVPLLHTLILDFCGIETISEDAFLSLTNLRVLILSNNEIEALHPATFHGLAKLETLLLDGNKITNLPDLLFSGLTLKDVNLEDNRIENISESAFQGAAIGRLRLDNNNFPRISEQTFGPLQNSLTELTLSHNKQPLDLESNVFANFSFDELTLCDNGMMNTTFLTGAKAKNLDIGANPLHSVDFQAYYNLQYTERFYLRNVSIDDLNDVTLSNLREVGLLDLSGNRLSDVHTDVFRHTPHLEKLLLSENMLTQVPRNLGVYLSDLVELDLHRNKISSLRPEDFASLNNLHVLDLKYNQIQVIPPVMQPVFDRISTVRLDGNPLHCNCEMRWFREWLDIYRTSMGVDFCHTPHFQYIFNLEYEDFLCTEPTLRSINTNLTVEVGSSFFLTCSAESDPAPQVEWSSPFGDVISITPSRNRTRLKTSAIWKIDDVRAEQAGVYTCSATNMAGRTEAHVCVQIQEGGIIISGPCVFPTEPPATTAPTVATTLRAEPSTAVVETTVALVTTDQTTAPEVVSTADSTIVADTKTTPTSAATTTSFSSDPATDYTSERHETTAIATEHRSTSTPKTQANSARDTNDDQFLTVAFVAVGSCVGIAVFLLLVFGLYHLSKKRRHNRDYELAGTKISSVNTESQA